MGLTAQVRPGEQVSYISISVPVGNTADSCSIYRPVSDVKDESCGAVGRKGDGRNKVEGDADTQVSWHMVLGWANTRGRR